MAEPANYSRAEILASVAANGLVAVRRDVWQDATHVYTARRTAGAGLYTLTCTRRAPCTDYNAAIRDALRPLFLAARREA